MWGISQVDNNNQINDYKTLNGITNPCAGTEGGGVNAFNVITKDQNFWGYPTYCIVCPDKKINFGICYPPEVTCFDPYFESCYPPPSADFSADITNPVIGQTVSFTDLSTEDPTSWLWTFTPSTFTYVGGTSFASQNPQVQFNSPGSYTVELFVANADSSDTEIKTDYINATYYCSASGAANLLHISNVEIGDINNSSGQDYYRDYTYLSTDLIQGQTDVEIAVENGNPYGNDDLGIWIDWNQDGDFYDAEENIVCEINDEGQGTFLFDVPETAISGTTTMRVRIKYNGSDCGDPCGTSTYGEVEDYTINIIENHINLNIKVFLEGPFNGSAMDASLNSILPLSQPFNTVPWNYPGIESVTALPSNNIVDWVLIGVRDSYSVNHATSATRIGRQAAFLRNDGQIVDIEGNPVLNFTTSFENNLYVVIYQRNHIPVISATSPIQSEGIYFYNFSNGAEKSYGGINGHKEIGTGIWGMFTGNSNGDNIVNDADKNINWMSEVGLSGYLSSDVNMDGKSNNKDKNESWLPNRGKSSFVPD
ncbi:MAG: hypothetical protein B6D61_05110 [Bacteroidetes bacterium 4484_249]|nr:MAG: hypothetical protein B6D61_05110 [Bacteroidetes bacterium 4484_249]